jgi:hypothetical protein
VSPEQQRIAIAKACGWAEISDWGAGGINGKHPKEPWTEVIPDYLNDLNAMAAAESIIIRAGAQTIRLYEDALQKFVANIVFATAAQQAEAFLKTLNLWKP